MKIMKNSLAALLLLCATSSAWSQPIITSNIFQADFLSPPSEIASWNTDDTTGLRALEILNGANQSWDFTGRAYKLQVNSNSSPYIPYSTTLPLATDPDFSSATEVYVDSINPVWKEYEYYRINATGFWLLGGSQDSMGVASKTDRYVPPFQQLKFPLTYLSTWQSSSTDYDLKYGDSTYETVEVGADGYGTIILPSSPNQTALRVSLKSTSSYDNGLPYTSYNFYWFTNSLYWAAVSADDSMRPQGAGYVQPTNSSVGMPPPSLAPLNLTLSDNPVLSAGTRLSYNLRTGGPVQVELMDELGQSVRMLENGRASAGTNIVSIDPKTLASGTYFIRVEAEGTSAMQKLVISH
jgi:Secretion system C-terminal sorting domain